MDSSEHRSEGDLPLAQLITHALTELRRLRYSRRSLRRYRTVWRHFANFAEENGLGDLYSDHLAARFIKAYPLPDQQCSASAMRSYRLVPFMVKVLGDFARDGRVNRPFAYTKDLRIPAAMKNVMDDYEQFARERRHLRPASLNERMRTVAVFVDYLGSKGVTVPHAIQARNLIDFVTTRTRLSARTASRTVSDIRCFLRFLVLRGSLRHDLTPVLPRIRVPRDSTIPSVWEPELLAKLLQVVDRSSARGKRDFAILLLACRLGMRFGDIRVLTLDQLNWDAATIEFNQSKSGAPQCLPMTEEVGTALIDYIKHGRPHVAYRELFIRARSPFTPFSDNNHFTDAMQYWRQLAGIRFRTKQHSGLHSLRHTLATQLLRQETPIHVISEILGHATIGSTMIYAKADVESLRAAALNTEEVRHGR